MKNVTTKHLWHYCFVLGSLIRSFWQFAFLIGIPLSMYANTETIEDTIFYDQETITISGTVLDDYGIPMVGVTVVQEDTSRGTTTDFNGNFTLEVDRGATVVVSYIGFLSETLENVTTNMSPLTITLQPDTTNLEEVVVIGYGKQTKQTLVGSVGSIKGEELLQVGSVNTISDALQGQVPGLTAINNGGKPGVDAASIFIRGRSSWVSSGPLVLIDGVERDINNIDPNEIESISVLKDAASTAVYGVRGANGVILLTTKRGKLATPTFKFSANLGIKQPTATQDKADYLTAMEAFNEAAMNDRNYSQIIPQSTMDAWREHYSERGPYNPYFPEVDWYDKMLGTGYEQTYNLNATGGSKLIKYFVSLGYRKDGDVFQTKEQPEYDPSFGVERYNWRSNFDFDITPTTRLKVGLSGNYRVRTQPGYRMGKAESGFFDRLYNAPQNLFPLEYQDGFPGESSDGEGNLLVFINGGGKRTSQYYLGTYDVSLDQQLDFITKGLSFNGSFSYTSYSNYSKDILRGGVGGSNNNTNINIIRYFRSYDYSQPIIGSDGELSYPVLNEIRWPDDITQEVPITSDLSSLSGYSRRMDYRFQLEYERNIGDHYINTTGLMLRQNSVSRNGFPTRREEWIARVSYNYKKRYLLEASGNYSGSEKFAPGKRFGFFPAIGGAWVISEEPFVKNSVGDWLDFLKVNYSYGIVGNDNVNRFQYTQTFTKSGEIKFGYENPINYGPRYTEGTIANPNATWETSTQQNLKFSADIFSKINVELDFYKADRKDILMERKTVPSFVGYPDLPDANIGRTKSHGYELALGWKDKVGANFKYHLNFSTSFTENRVLFRDDPAGLEDYQKHAGKPIGWVSRIIAGGYYQSLDDIFNGANQNNGSGLENLVPGDIQFVDFNGDGVADIQDQVPLEDVPYPLRTYSLNLGFNWKNFGFSAMLYGVTDVGAVIPDLVYFDFAGGFIQAQPNVLGRWTPQTAGDALKPALHLSNNHNSTPSTLLYQDGSYLRLKNIELNYVFKNKFFEHLGLERLQLYANGNNVLTWSNLDDRIDPEVSGTGTYPIVKRYNIGVRATF